MSLFIMTHSGYRFYPEEVERNIYVVEDIAYALSNESRYGGHGKDGYSVAQHSVLCSYLVKPENAFAALMHDATEAYVKDIPRPIKVALGAVYKDLEHRVWVGIAKQFNLAVELPEEVHKADMAMMSIEVDNGLCPSPEDSVWKKYDQYRTTNMKIDGVWSNKAAERAFLVRFWELDKPRKAA